MTTKYLGDYASSSEELPVRELFDDRSERDGGKECERAYYEDDTDEQSDEHRLVGAKRPERGRHGVLCRQGAGQREYRDDDGETPQQQAHRLSDVVEGGVGAEAGEGGTVVVRDRGERVEDLGKTVGPGVEWPGPPGMDRHRDGGEDENGYRHDQHPEGGEFHFPGLYLFSQILRRSSNH